MIYRSIRTTGFIVSLLIAVRAAAAPLQWEVELYGRSALLPQPNGAPALLRLMAPKETGILFTNWLSQDRYTTNQILLNGSGVAAGDVDGDGWCDLYFCGLDGPNALYRNRGDWTFENIAEASGVACPGLDATGALLADIDGDFDLDLIVNSIRNGTHILVNDGKARFTLKSILNRGKGGMSLAAADIDGDADLDLYVCNYRPTTLRDQPGTNFRIEMIDGKPVVAAVNGQPATSPELLGRFEINPSGRISEHGEQDGLYRNDGSGNFTLVSPGAFLEADGRPMTSTPFDWGLSAMFRDLNDDGAPDIYVCNDFHSVDRIWMNSGRGVFSPVAPLAFRNTSKFSMGVDVADVNRDGFDDVLVLDMLSSDHVTRLTRADKMMESTPVGMIDNRPQFGRNTFHLNRGDGTYAEIASFSGLDASDWSWTPIFVDLDLDGFEDLLVTTGHGRDDMDIDTGLRIEIARRTRKLPVAVELGLRRDSPPLPAGQLAFRNCGNLKFKETGELWGFDQVGISHGMCLVDLDNDGDLDVAVNNLNNAAGIYRNECGAARVAVQLRGEPGNTRGIGSKITVSGGALPRQSQEVLSGGRYLSSDQPRRVFAAETSTSGLRLEVRWRSGKKVSLEGIRGNRIYEIEEARISDLAPAVPTQNHPSIEPLFSDVSHLLGHSHHEELFDDYSRQALLPNRLSQLGPGISWIDLNRDGQDELVIGSGRGGGISVYERTADGKFIRWDHSVFNQPVTRDQTAILGWPAGNQVTGLLIGSASYEDGAVGTAAVHRYDSTASAPRPVVAGMESSIGPMALADLDADGTLELFVGGRVIPGRYPEPASSAIFRFHETNWRRDEINSAALREAGLVSGGVWTDLNGDGFPELVLACEWGPIKVYANQAGRLRDATGEWGLSDYRGWWNGVASGDFDGDGRMDLAASNWGLNTKYQASRERPRRLYFGQFGGFAAIETLESHFDLKLKKWVPERDLNSAGKALPWIREKIRSHRAYAQAGIEDILGEHLQLARVLEVNWLETTVFLNRGNHFERGNAPASAQFSPAFGINIADFDGDGAEDIFLAQNFFAVHPQTSRNDAGRGLLLKGDGKGRFEEMPESGIKVYGEQRGSAAGDFDSDGRVDLAVTQNGAATRLFRNLHARPGLRVALRGPKENPHGIGAKIRLGFGSTWGPAREIHCGSGYWSQDSLTQVLGTPSPPTRVQVQWPGGKVAVAEIPKNAREIQLEFSGNLQTKR